MAWDDWLDGWDDCFGHDSLESEHFEEVTYLRFRWQWIASWGELKDLRRIPLQYALNLVRWMDQHHDFNTPYKELGQYEYLMEKIRKQQGMLELARRVLQGPKHTWQTLRTYSSTNVSSVSSKETPAVGSR